MPGRLGFSRRPGSGTLNPSFSGSTLRTIGTFNRRAIRQAHA